MGRPRKFTTVEQLKDAWEKYKKHCNNRMVLTHNFSTKNSEFVSKELERRVTYTIEGFCVFVKMARQDFYANYAKDKKFSDMVTRMREECEVDAREKFELGFIPTQLAGLWMSRYGYTTKSEGNVEVKSSVMIVDDLDDS